MVRVSCNCKVCKINAKKVGASFPLSADIPEKLHATLEGDFHGIVYSAHDPTFVGESVRRQTGTVAIR